MCALSPLEQLMMPPMPMVPMPMVPATTTTTPQKGASMTDLRKRRRREHALAIQRLASTRPTP
jgi:hypothetical protein